MLCEYCDVQINDGEKFCSQCGAINKNFCVKTKIGYNEGNKSCNDDYLQTETEKTLTLDDEILVMLNSGDVIGAIDYYEMVSDKNYEKSCLYVGKLKFSKMDVHYSPKNWGKYWQDFKNEIKIKKTYEKKANTLMIFVIFFVGGIIIGIIGTIANPILIYVGLGCWLFGILGVFINARKIKNPY